MRKAEGEITVNKFIQHIPGFIGGIEPERNDFETTEDLLKLEAVRRYGRGKDFSHFALSDDLLMEISDEGLRWWVVGSIEKPEEVDLPKWDGGRYKAEYPDGTIKILTDEVYSSCGDKLTLRDGTEVKRIRS